MRAHPVLVMVAAYLVGSYFGLPHIMAMMQGARRPVSAAAQPPATTETRERPAAVLLLAFIFLAIGFALMYAGVHSGDLWRHPWSPFADQLRGTSGVTQ